MNPSYDKYILTQFYLCQPDLANLLLLWLSQLGIKSITGFFSDKIIMSNVICLKKDLWEWAKLVGKNHFVVCFVTWQTYFQGLSYSLVSIYRDKITNCYISCPKLVPENAINRYLIHYSHFSSVQFSSVTQSWPTLCDPMNHSMPGLPVHYQLLEFTQTHVIRWT